MIKIKKYFLSLMFHALLNHTMHFYTIKSNVVVPIPDIPCIFTFSELNWIVCFVLFLNHIIPAIFYNLWENISAIMIFYGNLI